jgi:hypothetical protein
MVPCPFAGRCVRHRFHLAFLQVYTVSGGKNIPAWLSDKKKKALRKDEEYRRRIELIQDFEFPAGCQKIKVTPDGQYIFASGYHPPQVSAARRYPALLPASALCHKHPQQQQDDLPPTHAAALTAVMAPTCCHRCAATTCLSCR